MKAIVETSQADDEVELQKATFFKKAVTQRRTYYYISVTVEFSEEERAVLTKHKLWETEVWSSALEPDAQLAALDRDLAKLGIAVPPNVSSTTIQRLAQGIVWNRFDTSVEALNFSTDVKTKYLPALKRLIDRVQGAIGSSETLEF